jgi:hypothetical protein
MYKNLPFAILLSFAVLVPAASAQDVRLHPDQESALSARWDWAQDRAPGNGAYWVGFSIERLMGEHSFYGWSDRDGKSLHELIYGTPSPEESLQDAAQRALAELQRRNGEDRKVIKDLAILFYFEGGSDRIVDGRIGNLSQSMDLEGAPLFWLGPAEHGESIALVRRQYERAQTEDAKEALISAAGVHDDTPEVVPFLSGILGSREDDDLREKAAFWMGQQDTPAALRILTRVVEEDRSQEVREQAVFAISQMDQEDATDTLINLARHEPNREVRKKAVFWLGQKASKKAVEALRDFVDDDADTEVQKQAVFALSQLPREDATPLLIDIARTHQNPEVRKQAIFWLGQSDDPRALDVLVELVTGKG